MLPLFAATAVSLAAYASRLDDYVARGLPGAGDPGAVLVLVDDRGVVHCRGFGVDSGGRPVTCRTPFAVASLTKSFTALEVSALMERGRLDVAAPVRRYLPWFRVADERASASITVAELLTMRSGLTTATGRAGLADRANDAQALERRVRALADARLASAPGTAYAYSNANYDVLGEIVAVIRGGGFEDALRADVLAPARLDGARFTRGAPPVAGFARWFGQPVRAGVPPAIRGDVAAAGLVVDAQTYGRYLAAHLDAGRSWSRVVAGPAAWARVHHSPDGSPYAMGWFELSGKGMHELVHTGDAPDFHAYAILFPERRIGAALFVNANEMADGGRAERFERGIARILTGRDPGPAPSVPPDLWPRIAALGGLVLLIANVARAPRRRAARTKRADAIMLGIAVTLLVALPFTILPAMGGSFAVGYLYTPDLTTLLVATLVVAAASGVLAAVRLAR